MADLENFTCAICQRMVETRWEPRRACSTSVRPPVCRGCERDYGKPAKDGAFADRRTVAVGSSLAEALSCEAHRQQWPEAWR